MTQRFLEKIYDKYAATLYGIALEICPDQRCAEQVFLKTFKNIYAKNKTGLNSPCLIVDLIKLVFSITKSEIYPNEEKLNLKLKKFDSTPLIQQLICTDENFEKYCSSNDLSLQDGLIILRKEFNSIKITNPSSF